MRNAGANLLPEDLRQASPVVLPPPSETSILCVTSNGYTLRGHGQNSSPRNFCLECFSKLPAWRSQIYKENHFLQFSRVKVDYSCHVCGIVIEKTRSPYSCKHCRDTLRRTISQFKTNEYDWNNFPSIARIISELED